jgi:1-deoxyxylulose-5-phosphate synthase
MQSTRLGSSALVVSRICPDDRGLSRQHLLSGIDASLQRLGTDYIDLYQAHRWDDATPIEETMQALHDIVRSGKARYLGASSMYAWQFAKAQHAARTHGWTAFASMQNHYNLLYREEEREMIPFRRDQGVGILLYSPLARGVLAGTRRGASGPPTTRPANDPLANSRYDHSDSGVVDVVVSIERERGLSLRRSRRRGYCDSLGISPCRRSHQNRARGRRDRSRRRRTDR